MTTRTEVVRTTNRDTWWLHNVRTVLTWAWHAYWERRANRAAVVMLQSLDAHALHDIGIHRSQIEWAVNGLQRERRPRHALHE
jgi:uncharacterized protein YjiS (DUF1127 family)